MFRTEKQLLALKIGRENQHKKQTTHSMYGTRPYRIYRGIIDRTTNKKNRQYKNYGERGIQCEWLKFEDFWQHMASNYSNELSIDRIDNNGNYSTNNCRWIKLTDQQDNRRNNVIVEYNGEMACLAFWERLSGLKKSTFRERYRKGWTIKQIMETPKLSKHAPKINNGKKV